MSNKTQLQENNADLQTIKSNVEDLPTANPWSGSTIIEPGSEAVTIPAYTDTELTVNPVQTEEKTVTPSGSQQIVTPAAGKYLNKVTVSGDANLIAANIAKGKTIFGVTGTANTSLSDFGVDFGEVVMTAGNTEVIRINHSLGAVPRKVVFTMTDYDNTDYTKTAMYESGQYSNGSYVYGMVATWISHGSSKHVITANAQSFRVYANMSFTSYNDDYPFKSGETYLWIAVK